MKKWIDFFEKNKAIVYSTCISLLIRCVLALKGLPNYSIDENEVVEMAISVTQGGVDHKFYKYGPFVSYILAFIYMIYGWWLSIFSSDIFSINDALKNVFFDKFQFYYIARIVQAIFGIISAVYIYLILKMKTKKRIAFAGFIFALFPWNEILSVMTIRIDTFFGTFITTGIYYLLCYEEKKEIKNWFKFVFFSTLVFGIKPLPAISVFVLIVFMMFYYQHKGEVIRKSILVIFLTILISYPFAIFKFNDFFQYNYHSFLEGGDAQKNKLMGYNFSWFYGFYGIVFSITSFLATTFMIFSSIKKFKSTKFYAIILSFPLIYILFFIPFGIRYYWYLPVIPFVIVFIFLMYEDLINSKKWAQNKWVLPLFCLLLVSENVIRISPNLENGLFKHPSAEEMYKIVQEKLKSNDKIIIIASHFSLAPLLVDANINKEAQHGQYFMYSRSSNPKYVKLFEKGYQAYQGKTFHLFEVKKMYQNYEDTVSKNILDNKVFDFAQQNNIVYVLACVTDKNYKAKWEKKSELIAEVRNGKKFYGYSYKLFKLKL